jgi:hypothetical protein
VVSSTSDEELAHIVARCYFVLSQNPFQRCLVRGMFIRGGLKYMTIRIMTQNTAIELKISKTDLDLTTKFLHERLQLQMLFFVEVLSNYVELGLGVESELV